MIVKILNEPEDKQALGLIESMICKMSSTNIMNLYNKTIEDEEKGGRSHLTLLKCISIVKMIKMLTDSKYRLISAELIDYSIKKSEYKKANIRNKIVHNILKGLEDKKINFDHEADLMKINTDYIQCKDAKSMINMLQVWLVSRMHMETMIYATDANARNNIFRAIDFNRINNMLKDWNNFKKERKRNITKLIIEYMMINVKSKDGLHMDVKICIANRMIAQEAKCEENKGNDLGRILMLMNIFSNIIEKDVYKELLMYIVCLYRKKSHCMMKTYIIK
ncbi:hypothetical protein OCOL_000721 [Ordospora colligata]